MVREEEKAAGRMITDLMATSMLYVISLTTSTGLDSLGLCLASGLHHGGCTLLGAAQGWDDPSCLGEGANDPCWSAVRI